MSNHVKVMRNPRWRDGQPWLVICELCAGQGEANGFGWMLAALTRVGIRGWAPTWQIAQDYATRHALQHEATRCQTCLHLPASPLPSEQEATA